MCIRDRIYTHIFEDLDFCMDSRLSVAQSDGGRVTMWAAKALKARLLLTLSLIHIWFSELEFTGVEYGCMVGWETVRY